MNSFEIIKIIKVIADLPANRRVKIIDYAALLINPRMTARDRVIVIETVANIGHKKRETVIREASLLVTQHMSGTEVEAIVKAITTVPANANRKK